MPARSETSGVRLMVMFIVGSSRAGGRSGAYRDVGSELEARPPLPCNHLVAVRKSNGSCRQRWQRALSAEPRWRGPAGNAHQIADSALRRSAPADQGPDPGKCGGEPRKPRLAARPRGLVLLPGGKPGCVAGNHRWPPEQQDLTGKTAPESFSRHRAAFAAADLSDLE